MATLNEQEIYLAICLMEEIGGSFARNLAKTWFSADRGNRTRIEVAFDELLHFYHDMANARRT